MDHLLNALLIAAACTLLHLSPVRCLEDGDLVEVKVAFRWLPGDEEMRRDLSDKLPFNLFKLHYYINLFTGLKRQRDGLLQEATAFLLVDYVDKSKFSRFARNKDHDFNVIYDELIVEPCQTIISLYRSHVNQLDTIWHRYSKADWPLYQKSNYDAQKLSSFGLIASNCYILFLDSSRERVYENLLKKIKTE